MKKVRLCYFAFISCLFYLTNTVNAQPCSGTWSRIHPLNYLCVDGQWIGEQNGNDYPVGCPVNPVYNANQTITFTFTNPVSAFKINFNAFSGNDCSRIQVKINNIFYPLGPSNFVDITPSTGCSPGDFSLMQLTPDGYICGIPGITAFLVGQGCIIINGVVANSVTLSTNDPAGSVFSIPFECFGITPVKLESFKGISDDHCTATLSWKTGIETNVKEIEVERSVDGIVFKYATTVLSKGSNSYYSINTDNPADAFFRLKFIDLDGHLNTVK